MVMQELHIRPTSVYLSKNKHFKRVLRKRGALFLCPKIIKSLTDIFPVKTIWYFQIVDRFFLLFIEIHIYYRAFHSRFSGYISVILQNPSI